jgi:uncharacterized protein YaiI (UPF0178 family)
VSATAAILVDADACPVKDEIYKVAFRRCAPTLIVSNGFIRIPEHPLISRLIVDGGFDAADDAIVARAGPGTIVVTGDILLADRALKKGSAALAPDGRPFTVDSIGSAIAARALMADLRAGANLAGIKGGAPFSKADRSRFLSALDEALARLPKRP